VGDFDVQASGSSPTTVWRLGGPAQRIAISWITARRSSSV